MIVSRAEKTLYCAFSKGETEGDLNSGASGAVDDYCLKSVDASNSISGTAYTRLLFPKTYGDTSDTCRKYRIEADWKWQTYSGTPLAQTATGSPGGATILTFFIGDNRVCLVGKSSDATGDARGNNALYFQGYSGATGTSTAFGLYASNQTTAAADTAKVTKSAARFTEKHSGKWIHITVDLDFANSTIYATLESDGEKREISTEITSDSNKTLFAKGINAIGIYGSTKADRRINFADNIKITPIMTEAPTLQKDGTKLKWNAIEGATSYNVYFGNSESAASASTTPVENLTFDEDAEPGYVTVDLGALGANVPSYYTVTAVSDNKGESVKSNVVDMTNRQNVVSDIAVAGGKATVSINAGEGFANPLYLIAAEYNGSELTNVVMSGPEAFSQGTAENMEVSFASEANINNMKFFLWDSNLIPVKMWEVANLGN